ncbi:Tat binding protein 1-interacting protein-domain-containing protein [Tricharina praecox]|uniref:Tat binding protein 1-interacting protein-domain-containing protein n=1 Tax=Tricharina praecox TaxID=43433 RepID=UPI00221E9AEA|nr:Tat binding protein 1-interacting protein-domain-containing protein [Tricharina praecox]KAI5855395.1 Tat binding protein 1-interacting protein-domain-containing protein [Tricharina praecox]
MPPKKEKKEQFKGDQASEMIFEYLEQQNRPYSAADVSSNLHNAVTKATATKILKEMHESGQIEGRVSGKQIVYHAIQSPTENSSEEDLKAMDEEIEGIKAETAALKASIKAAHASLAALKSTPSIDALNDSIEVVEAEAAALEETLKGLRAVSETPVADPATRAAAEKEYAFLEKEYARRRKQFREFWGMVCDGYEGDVKELWENAGLEGDMI